MTEETLRELEGLVISLSMAYCALSDEAEPYKLREDALSKLLYAELIDLRGLIGHTENAVAEALSKKDE